MKKIVKGNDFTLRIQVMKMVEGQPQAFPLPACTDVVVQVCNQFKRIPLAFEIDIKEDNVLLARVEGDKMSLGTYAIEVKGKIFGNDWRSNEYPQFAIVSNNADADTEFGETDEGDNSVEMDTAMVILPPTVELSDLIDKANEALKNSKETNDTLNANEEARKEAETLRGTAEQGRVSAEEARVSAECDRTKAEEGRVSAETDRVKAEQVREKRVDDAINDLDAHKTAFDAAENLRVQSEKDRQKAEFLRVQAEKKRVAAEEKRMNDTNKAIQAAETATTGAERVNVELEGNVLKVTNRNGEVKSLDFEQWDLEEKVNITISTSVEGVSIKGVIVNVFLNGATTSTKYTSDTEGKISFVIPRGTIYKVSFQELKNCDPLPSLTYTAALRVRDINVEYKALSGETASVVVTIDKAESGAVKPMQGVAVTCEVTNGDTTTTETDENGKVTFSIPWGKTYKITAGKPEGYYAFRGIYEKNNVADVAEHNLYYHFFPITSGVFILDTAGAQYTLDEWQESGKTAEDAVLVKITTQNLAEHNSSVGFSPSALQAGYPSKAWCTQKVLFNSIALNGGNTTSELYYDGYKASKLIREEAQERGLIVPAFSYAYDCTVEMAGETLHGYVASVGQMAEMNINKIIVDNVINALYGNTAKVFSLLFGETIKWTSAQYKTDNGWGFVERQTFGIKINSNVVIPVFVC